MMTPETRGLSTTTGGVPRVAEMRYFQVWIRQAEGNGHDMLRNVTAKTHCFYCRNIPLVPEVLLTMLSKYVV